MSKNIFICFYLLLLVSSIAYASDLSKDEVERALQHPSNKSLLDAMPSLGLDMESHYRAIAEMLAPQSLPKKGRAVPMASSSRLLLERDPIDSDVVAPVFPGFKTRIAAAEKAKENKNFKDSTTTDELMQKLLRQRMKSEEK